MDGSRFSDPIKIKPRATESLSLPVGNCGEGSIRSKTSSGYYILVIVFQQYPLHLIDVFCCLFLKYLSLLLIHCTWFFPPSGNAIRVSYVFTWNRFFPRSFDWDFGRVKLHFVIIIFKRHLLLFSSLFFNALKRRFNLLKLTENRFFNRFFSFVILALHSWLVYLIGLCHKITSRNFFFNIKCFVSGVWSLKKNPMLKSH